MCRKREKRVVGDGSGLRRERRVHGLQNLLEGSEGVSKIAFGTCVRAPNGCCVPWVGGEWSERGLAWEGNGASTDLRTGSTV
jgi:hypothetical protein